MAPVIVSSSGDSRPRCVRAITATTEFLSSPASPSFLQDVQMLASMRESTHARGRAPGYVPRVLVGVSRPKRYGRWPWAVDEREGERGER